MSDLPIQIVDEDNQPIGQATKQVVWRKGLIHRVVRIMAENLRGEVLLQKRTPDKDIFPDTWDNSAAGHVDAGESYLTAAQREIAEELGLTDVSLTEIGNYYVDSTWHGLRFKRFTKVYKMCLEVLPTKLEQGKVSEVRWFTIADMKRLVAEQPEKCSDGLMQVVERYY